MIDKNKKFNSQFEKLNINAKEILLEEIGLKKKSQEVLYKRYVQEKTYYNIADELNYTVESTRKLVHNSKKDLKEIADEQEDFLSENVKKIIKFLKK